MNPSRSITLYFDDTCHLCHACVRWVLQRDTGSRVLARPIAESAFDPAEGLAAVDNAGVWRASSAALRVFRHLPRLWPLVWWLVVVPRAWRDACYWRVAAHRHSLAACTECRVTDSAEAVQSNGE